MERSTDQVRWKGSRIRYRLLDRASQQISSCMCLDIETEVKISNDIYSKNCLWKLRNELMTLSEQEILPGSGCCNWWEMNIGLA